MKGRRKFLEQATLAASALSFPGSGLACLAGASSSAIPNTGPELEVHLFSKALQFLNYRDMCEVTRDLGFDGVDLTVRPGGHVEPERVQEELPAATEAMKHFGLIPRMLASSVMDARDPMDRKVLETAGSLAYDHYRPAWYRYGRGEGVLEIVEKARTGFRELASMNRELGIAATYHNHSGNFFGSAIWDLYEALKDLDPEYFGSQYDIMHAHIEGGRNWEYNLELIRPYINTLVVKDFDWQRKNRKWIPVYVPMGNGRVDFEKYFRLLIRFGIRLPVSLHAEYDLGGAEKGKKPNMAHDEIFRKIGADLEFLRHKWRKALDDQASDSL